MHNTFYSDEYYDEYDSLTHFGVKGMHWGIRRTPEQLGRSPTKTGRQRRSSARISRGFKSISKSFKKEVENIDSQRKAYIEQCERYQSKVAKVPEKKKERIVGAARDSYDTGVFLSAAYHESKFDADVVEKAASIYRTRSVAARNKKESEHILSASIDEAYKQTPREPYDKAYKQDAMRLANAVYNTAKAANVTSEWADPRAEARKETLGDMNRLSYTEKLTQDVLDATFDTTHKFANTMASIEQYKNDPYTYFRDASKKKNSRRVR